MVSVERTVVYAIGRSSRRAWTSETVPLPRSHRMFMRRYSASVRVGVGRLAMSCSTTPTPYSPRGSRSRFPGGLQPCGDAALQDVQRERALLEDDLVEGADVEPAAQGALGPAAQLADLELADLVRQRLAGVGDVAVDLVGDVELRLRGVGEEIVDRALARPALRVDPGVDDQPDRSPHLVRQR